MTKRILMISILFLACISLHAQEFVVPKNYVLKRASDFKKYEADVIACINWLENTPLNEEVKKRKEANAFFLEWIVGNKSVSISIDADILSKYTDKNSDFLTFFMGGWTRYSLENNYSKDKQQGYYEGLKSIVNIYKKGIGVKKDEDVDELVEMYENGELEEWIKDNVK